MRYVALLRGVNVGGNNIIKMLALKEAFEILGFKDVLTYIQSGNVVFTSHEKDNLKLTSLIEKMIRHNFGFSSKVIIKSFRQMEHIVSQAPSEWQLTTKYRCYIGFLLDSVTPTEAMNQIPTKEGVDTIKVGPDVIYMSTLLTELTKSSFNKMVSQNIYQQMTIRNFNTSKKLLTLLKDN